MLSRVPPLSLPMDASRPAIPNLPGFRPNKQVVRNRDHVFHYDAAAGACLEVKPQPLDAIDGAKDSRYITSARSYGDHTPRGEARYTPRYVEMDGKVLRFYAYFQQSVPESPLETYRIRKCTILYYLVDGSVQVMEPKTQNSGLPQGTLVKRHQVPLTRADGSTGVIAWQDLNIGSEVTIYGRTYRVVSCDQATRKYMQARQLAAVPSDESYPAPGFRQSRVVGGRQGPSIKIGETEIYGRGNSELKQYMEASLGKPTARGVSLQQFLENDRKVLRFFCVWDARAEEGGEKRQYTLLYFLSDDQIEILETRVPNDGRDFFPTLLKKQALPKQWQEGVAGIVQDDGKLTAGRYGYRDLQVGAIVNVFGRNMLLFDCDEATRQWYASVLGQPQPATLDVTEPMIPPIRAPTPPYNGFGTEEDSRGSCFSLTNKPPRKDTHKFFSNDKKLLRFSARLCNVGPQSQGRRFVITYYLADDTMQIYEPPDQNSGIMGGRFLQRGRHKSASTGRYLMPDDFFVGARLTLNSFTFEVLEADQYSTNLMAKEMGLETKR